MDKTIAACLILVGIIHLLPVSGVLGAERLSMLYGIPIQEPNLEILMRHRAVLFFLLGIFLIAAAFLPQMRLLAMIAGFISVLSFLLIAWTAGGYNEAVHKVVIADIIAVIALGIAAVLHFVQQSHTQ